MAVTLFPLSPIYSLLLGDCSTPRSIQSASSLQKVTSAINTFSFTHDYHNFEKNQKITLFNFRCSNVAEVRLLWFWEARNLRKGGELMSVDMLFVDENVSLFFHEYVLQFISSRFCKELSVRTVSVNRQVRFRERLSKGSLYTLTGFDVVYSNTNFCLSDAPFLVPFAKLTLRLRSDKNVCVSMFDSLALAFHTKLDSYGRKPRVVIATSVNPKIVGGHLFLNGTSGTHLYFHSDTAAGKEVFDIFGCIVAFDAAMTKVTNFRAVEVPHPMGQGEEQDPRNPSKKVWT
ncbi:unnamed protein product [Brassica napus]|uniref:(rape) hypothetical protein n=1 Tax=Brassica napus TaxID=3708 RepID=A0A816IX51_BRANA|nr:unnamed protein product [Brassica napus]